MLLLLPQNTAYPLYKTENNSCFIASFAFVLRPPSFGRPQRQMRARPAPLYLKRLEENILKKQTKTEIISTRVTPEQREIIQEKAYSSYRTPSMYLRDCALDKKIIVVKGVDEAANELRKIGNNLNQLTRAVNSGYCYEVDLRETREEVAKLWQSLNSLTQEVR